MSTGNEQRRNLILEFYETVKDTALTKYINWEFFAREAESVGLHYDRRLGLMTAEMWESIKDFLMPEIP